MPRLFGFSFVMRWERIRHSPELTRLCTGMRRAAPAAMRRAGPELIHTSRLGATGGELRARKEISECDARGAHALESSRDGHIEIEDQFRSRLTRASIDGMGSARPRELAQPGRGAHDHSHRRHRSEPLACA